MITLRTNLNGTRATAADCFAAMERQERAKPDPAHRAAHATAPSATGGQGSAGDGGDIIYGAKAIAWFLFGDDGNRARRRVFNLWAHYSRRKERAGFFKLKGALCLSKSQWRGFHGLG